MRFLSPLSRRFSLMVAISFSLFVYLTFSDWQRRSALAFIPTSRLSLGGLLGDSHVKITGDAIETTDKSLFGVSELTIPMMNASTEIQQANVKVDDDQFHSALHFDGENFPEGQERLINLARDVKSALECSKPDTTAARRLLGEALHTVQDFYSHSNWIELNHAAVVHPGLGLPNVSLGQLPENVQTCRFCDPPLFSGCTDCDLNLTTTELTSGYYRSATNVEDRLKPNLSKCSHGGLFDFTSVPGDIIGGINKDSTDCTLSPHWQLHPMAASAARAATRKYILDLRDYYGLSNSQLKLLLGASTTLAIAIDTTGSMGGVIAGVKQQAIQIVNDRLGTSEEPTKYVLSPFNDPDVGPATVTCSADEFKNAINALSASGGGDCPELAMTGMLRAIAEMDEGGKLFVFTDADAKDAALTGNVVSLAAAKKIQIYLVLFGSCGFGPSAAQGQSPPTKTSLAGADPSYTRVANETGGQVFTLFPSEAGQITRLADFVVRANVVNLLSIGDALTGTEKTYQVPVNSGMPRATFSISGPSSITVKRPDGSDVLPTDADLSTVSVTDGKIFSVVNPAVGNWSVVVNGSGPFSITVTGESDLALSSFRFVELGGRPGHQGYFPISGSPLAGQQTTVDAIVTGAFNTAQFELRSKTGALIQALTLETGNGDFPGEFYGTVTLPGSGFLAYVTGLDSTGKPYQRLLPTLLKPQSVKVTAPPSRGLQRGQTTNYTFQVQNLGASGTFRFTAADNRGFVQNITPTNSALNTNQTIDATVALRPPANATPGLSDTLTVTAENISDSSISNFAVVTSLVTAEGAKFESGKTAVSLSDPLRCTGAGNVLSVHAQFTNSGTALQGNNSGDEFVASLPPQLLSLGGSCTATGAGGVPKGTCVVSATQVTWNGGVAIGETINIDYQVQVTDGVTPGTQLCVNSVVFYDSDNDGSNDSTATVSACTTINCPAVGPGLPFPAGSEVSDQKAGSVLVYNVYTSGAGASNTQNTRITLTNTNPSLPIAVHLFFVDGASCSVADSTVCLTPNQTINFLASDLDPGTTGYLVVVASDPATGCPVNFNYLIGDEYVKFTTGHAANLAAESFAAIAGGLPACNANSSTAVLRFDGVSYNLAPRVLALDSIGSRADGNDTLLILNRIGGNLGTGANSLSAIFGILYDDAEASLSFSFNSGSCQLRSPISSNFPRTAPRFEQFIPAGRSGWMKFWSDADGAILGAAINVNPSAGANAGAYNQGHNLHKLRLSSAASFVVPVFPPSC